MARYLTLENGIQRLVEADSSFLPLVGAYAYRSTSLSIPAGGAAVFFNNTRWNSNNIYLPVQSSRLTAPFTGVYDLGGAIVFTGIGLVSNRELRLRINGNTTIALDNRQSVASTVTSLSVMTQWRMNAGDYVELVAGHGSLISIDLAIGEVQPNLWMSLRQKG